MTTDTEARIQAAAQRAYDRNDIAATARRIAEIAKQIDARSSHVTDRRSLNALHEAENTLAAILHAADMRDLATRGGTDTRDYCLTCQRLIVGTPAAHRDLHAGRWRQPGIHHHTARVNQARAEGHCLTGLDLPAVP